MPGRLSPQLSPAGSLLKPRCSKNARIVEGGRLLVVQADDCGGKRDQRRGVLEALDLAENVDLGRLRIELADGGVVKPNPALLLDGAHAVQMVIELIGVREPERLSGRATAPRAQR
jgi:hypothetical protein